jgi:hypothetical protein
LENERPFLRAQCLYLLAGSPAVNVFTFRTSATLEQIKHPRFLGVNYARPRLLSPGDRIEFICALESAPLFGTLVVLRVVPPPVEEVHVALVGQPVKGEPVAPAQPAQPAQRARA